MVPRIVGKVTRRSPAAVEDTRFAKAYTDRPLKMQVPGPMTVIDSTLNEFYDDESELAFDIAIALNQELLEIEAAGCDVIQIDEPARRATMTSCATMEPKHSIAAWRA
jgi:5-methyltetrahydropteroyltriglutamate--homocysteine methyltransferase